MSEIKTHKVALGATANALLVEGIRAFDSASSDYADPTTAGVTLTVAFRQDGGEPELSEFKTATWDAGSWDATTGRANGRYVPFAPLAESLVEGPCQVWVRVVGGATQPKFHAKTVLIY